MTYTDVKYTKPRFSTQYISNLGIQSWGRNNVYPQDMARLLNASGTGGVCLERYATFLEGNGFKDEAAAELVCNKLGETCNDLLHLISWDIARYHGFALHVNYNGLGDICEVRQVPFECCRLEEEKADGTVLRIAFHPDWTGNKTRNGKKIQVNTENILWYPQFNPIREVVLSEIENYGGITNFPGQILWVSLRGKNRYPTTIYDKVTTELSVDEGLGNVKYRNVRCNFLPAGMLKRRRGSALTVDANNETVQDQAKEKQIMDANAEVLKDFMGDENTGSIIEVYLQDGESAPEWMPIESENFDKKFDSTTADTTQRIYAAFSQEPWYSLRVAKNGFGGDVLADAYDYYNSYLTNRRKLITRNFANIFKHSAEKSLRNINFEIEPLVMIRQKWANLNQPVNQL